MSLKKNLEANRISLKINSNRKDYFEKNQSNFKVISIVKDQTTTKKANCKR